MSIFSDIKKYRRPLTDINEKIQYLNERMTSSGFYWEVDDPGQPWEIGDTPDDKMGDLADTDNFTVADQTGSSPDMSQLTTTDALGNTVNRLSTPEGSGGLGIIRYANMGTLGGTYYSVLRSDNRTGDSYLTSVSGGDPAVRAWVEANYNKWTTVQWHYYANPGMADNVFNPIARNVGPGGAYTLWGASLLVVKNPNFVNQQGISATYNKYGLDSTRYFYFRSRGSSGGGRTITSRLYGFGNAMRGVGGFVGGFAGKNFNKFLRNAARAGIPVGDINQATAIFYGHPPAPPKPAPAPAPVTSIPDKGLEKMPTIGPDIPDKGLEKMPTIEPDKPETPPVPPVPPAPPTPPKPTPPPPAPTPPKPDPKPTPKPTPPKGSIPNLTPIPSPDDLAKIGAPPPPPTAEWGNRSDYFDKYYSKAWYDDSGYKTDNSFVNDLFDKVRYTLDTRTESGLRRTEDGKMVPKYTPEFYAEVIAESERLYKNAQESYDNWTGSEFAKKHLKSQVDYHKKLLEKNKASAEKTAREDQERYERARDRFTKSGGVLEYIDTYKDSHPRETDKVAEKAVDDNFDNAQKEFSSNKEAILKELMKDPLFRVGKNLAEYSAPTTAKLFLDFLTGDLPPTIDNAYLGKDYVNQVLEKGILSDDAQFKMPFGDFIIATGQPITSDDYNPLTDEVSVKFNYNFQDTKTVMSGAQGTAMETFYKALNPIASIFSGGEKYKLDSLPVPLASKYIEKAEKLGGAKGSRGEIKLKLSDIKKSNPKFYNQLINKNIIDRTRVEESFNLNESIEFEQQTGVPVDHVANVMNGIADAVEVLNDCIISLHKSSRTWKRPQNKKRYEIETDIEGSETKPLEITLSENTNQYLLTNAFTGEPYHPEKDGRLSEFIVGNASRPIDQGGNVAAKCVIDNLIRTPEVIIDNEENIVMMGQIYLFNSKQGVEYSIMTQAMSALSGITDRLGFSIEGFKGNWNQQYESEIRAAFAGIEDLDKEVPILNVVLKIPFDQAHLYTMNSYLHSPENVKESMLAKWKKRTSPEDRHNQGEYEFFLNALSSLPSVAQTYIKIELAMQLENLLKAPNQQMDPKMIKVMSMVNANDVYVDNTFVENEKLFDKLKKSIKKNIQLTDPNTFKATPTPIKHDDVVESKQRSIKKYLPGNKKKSRQTFLTKK